MDDRDLPVGLHEITRVAGVERATADRWRERELLPDPDWAEVGGRPAWRLGTILDWLRASGRWPTRGMVAATDRAAELGGQTPAEDWNSRLGRPLVAALAEAGLVRRHPHWTGCLTRTLAGQRVARHAAAAEGSDAAEWNAARVQAGREIDALTGGDPLTAWVTTRELMPEAPPALSVTAAPVDERGRQIDEAIVLAVAEADWTANGAPVSDGADQLLSTLGYRRTSEWTHAGTAWTADLEVEE